MSTEIALDGVEAYKAQSQELKDAWGRNTDLLQQLEAEKLMSHTLRHHLMSKEAELAASQARQRLVRSYVRKGDPKTGRGNIGHGMWGSICA